MLLTLSQNNKEPSSNIRVRRRDAATTENAILKAAEKLFSRNGFEGVSTKQLAIEAGVAIGTLYHHYPSKEDIYSATTKRAFAKKANLPKKIINSQESPERHLVQLTAWFVRSVILDKKFGQLMKREMLDPRPSTPNLLDENLFQQPVRLFKELIIKIYPHADVDEATASMLALIFGFSSLKGIYSLFPSIRETLLTPEEIAEHATSLLLRGLHH